MEEESRLITTQEACRILGRTPGSISRYVKEGLLEPAVGGGHRDYYFRESEVRAFRYPRKGNPLFRTDWNKASHDWKSKPRQRGAVRLSKLQVAMLRRIEAGKQPDVIVGTRPWSTLRVLLRHGFISSKIRREGARRVHTDLTANVAQTA